MVFLLSEDADSQARVDQMKREIRNMERDKRTGSAIEIMLDELSEKSVVIAHDSTKAEPWLTVRLADRQRAKVRCNGCNRTDSLSVYPIGASGCYCIVCSRECRNRRVTLTAKK